MSATCALCGRIADPAVDGDPPLAWSAERGPTPDGLDLRWVCPPCTRHHVRSIEAKLDDRWW